MPPKASKSAAKNSINRTLVLDNGAHTIKAGFANPDPQVVDCHVIPNCIARGRDKSLWVASQLDECRDFGEMAFRRPVEKGYIVNWEGERAVWEHAFFSKNAPLKCDPGETNLILTEAPNCPQAIQANCDQMIFEEFEFASYYRCLGPLLNAYNDIPGLFNDPPRTSSANLPAECLLLIDSGHSHTTITPIFRGHPIQKAFRRLDIGGKLMTNYLKELISLRGLGVMDEPYLISEIKEDVCYVSKDFRRDIERTWGGGVRDRRGVDTSIVVDYVLPDYRSRQHGFARQHDPLEAARRKRTGIAPNGEAIVTLGNERFAVPELLFHPTDIGMMEAGLPEVIMQSLEVLPEGLKPAMLANVVVIGGNAKISGFLDRLEIELRQIMPSEYPLRVKSPPDPITYTWLGGARLVDNTALVKNLLVTREEYLENGQGRVNWLQQRFLHA